MVPWSASGHDTGGLAVGAPRDLAELAVEEDPVVELAEPVGEVGITDQPADLRERRPERRPVDRDPAVSGTRSLDDVDAAVLGRGAVAARQRRVERLEVERLRGRGAAVGRRWPSRCPGLRVQVRSPIRARPYWPSWRSLATYALQRVSSPRRSPLRSTEPIGRRSTLASRCASSCAVEPTPRPASQSGGSPSGGGRAEARPAGRPAIVLDGHLVGDGHARRTRCRRRARRRRRRRGHR